LNLSTAINIKPSDVIAFVGAGGKTSAIFTLAQEVDGPVVITTTTHLGVWQAALADSHYIVDQPGDLAFLHNIEKGTILLTGPATKDDRLSGLTEQMMMALGDFCKRRGLTLLIEADGARQRPLKAPADYEPVIPSFVDKVVVMSGLDGLGKPLSYTYVHRPERFSRISGSSIGKSIEVSDLVKVLSSEQGGLKGIPEGSERVLFLNQADDAILAAKGNRLAQQLIKHYDRIMIGSLHKPGQEGVVFSIQAQTAGVILAAGGSERYGKPKQLLDWGGKPFTVNVVQAAIDAGLNPIYVVTGSDPDKVAYALRYFAVRFVYNDRWEEGQSTSMKAGLNALSERCDSVVFLLSDQPQISPLIIRQLVEARSSHRSAIIAPMADGRRGNPVLFGREVFDHLEAVSGDQGGRAVFSQFKVDWLPWIDSRIQMDVDQPGDEERLKSAYHNRLFKT
jgi:molybdenum cofactor cytidylyltransferase